MKGQVIGGKVSIYALNDNGEKGDLVKGPITSDESGNVDFDLAEQLSTPRLIVESVGGSYRDEVTGNIVRLSDNEVMRSVLPAGLRIAAVTPFTHMATALATAWMKQGIPPGDAVTNANIAVAQQYNVYSILETIPSAANNPDDVATAKTGQRQYGLLLAGFAQLAKDMNVKPIALADALAKDWSDGILDGKQGGQPITIEDMSGRLMTLPANTGLNDFQAAVNTYIANPNQVTNLKQMAISLTPVLYDPKFAITTTKLPVWRDDEGGSYTVTAKGGTPPYKWRLRKGTLPKGFSLSVDGVISGTGKLDLGSVESLSPPFIVAVNDSSSPQLMQEVELRIRIVQKSVRIIVQDATFKPGEDVSAPVVVDVTGGTPPYHFVGYSSSRGKYPLGLGIWDPGVLKGKAPKNEDTYAIQVCAVDLVGSYACDNVTVNVWAEEKKGEGGRKILPDLSTGARLVTYLPREMYYESEAEQRYYRSTLPNQSVTSEQPEVLLIGRDISLLGVKLDKEVLRQQTSLCEPADLSSSQLRGTCDFTFWPLDNSIITIPDELRIHCGDWGIYLGGYEYDPVRKETIFELSVRTNPCNAWIDSKTEEHLVIVMEQYPVKDIRIINTEKSGGGLTVSFTASYEYIRKVFDPLVGKREEKIENQLPIMTLKISPLREITEQEIPPPLQSSGAVPS